VSRFWYAQIFFANLWTWIIYYSFAVWYNEFPPCVRLVPAEYERRHEQASENLAHARQEAREFGVQRREEIRERVREFRRLEEESRISFETERVKERDD